MRVLMLSHLYPSRTQPTRGIFVHRQAMALRRAGAEVRVIAPVPMVPPCGGRFGNYRLYSGVPDQDHFDGIAVSYPRYLQPPRSLAPALATEIFARQVRAPIVDCVSWFRPDVLHAQVATPDGLTGVRIGFELGVPVVCSLRGSDINVVPHRGRRMRQLTVECITRAAAVTAVSKALRDAAMQLVERPIDVVYTGVDPDTFQPRPDRRTEIRQGWGLSDDACVLSYVGNLFEAKGVYLILDVVATLKQHGYKVAGVFIGDGPEETGLRARMNELRISGDVILAGRVPQGEIAALLSASDAMVFPSKREGLPNAVVEALACGIPVVATDVGGTAEIVQSGVNGILVQPGHATELLEACARLVRSPELRSALASNARADVINRFSWNANANRMLEVYASASVGRSARSWAV